jgi:hypothetical protein
MKLDPEVNAKTMALVLDAMLRRDIAVRLEPRACGAVWCQVASMDGETVVEVTIGHHTDLASNRLEAILRASESYLRAREATVMDAADFLAAAFLKESP